MPSDAQAADLLEVIEDRGGLRSTIVTSQFPVVLWHEGLGEPTSADAILRGATLRWAKTTAAGEERGWATLRRPCLLPHGTENAREGGDDQLTIPSPASAAGVAISAKCAPSAGWSQ